MNVAFGWSVYLHSIREASERISILFKLRIALMWQTVRELAFGLRVSAVPLASVLVGVVLYGFVLQVQDLFLEFVGSTAQESAFWLSFYAAVLLGWALPVYVSSRWVLDRYHSWSISEPNATRVAPWVIRFLPLTFVLLCLLAVLVGQLKTLITYPEEGPTYMDEDILVLYDFMKVGEFLTPFPGLGKPLSERDKQVLWLLIGSQGFIFSLYGLGLAPLLWRFGRAKIGMIKPFAIKFPLQVTFWIATFVAIYLVGILVIVLYILYDYFRLASRDAFQVTSLALFPPVTVIIAATLWGWARRKGPIPSRVIVALMMALILPLTLTALVLMILVDPLEIAHYVYRASSVAIILGVWVPVLTIASLWSFRLRAPLLVGTFALLLVTSWICGDSHDIRTIKLPTSPALSTLDESLAKWAKANGCELPPPTIEHLRNSDLKKIERIALRRKSSTVGKECPSPIIISAAGGGSRASFLIGSALGTLMDWAPIRTDIPHFNEQLFAISGVSGGSLAGVVFNAALAESLLARQGQSKSTALKPPCVSAQPDPLWFGANVTSDEIQLGRGPLPPNQSWRSCLQVLLAGDFLSPTIIDFALPDVLKSPFRGDSAATLERAWEKRFSTVTGKNTLGVTFAELRKRVLASGENIWLPLLVLNGTSVSTGRRIIMADFDVLEKEGAKTACRGEDREWLGERFVSSLCTRLFKDSYDVYELFASRPPEADIPIDGCANCDVRLSTAALMSARFPLLSPHGNIRDASGLIADRVVDGGYFENNAAVTTQELADALRKRGLRPLTVLITNDPATSRIDCRRASFADDGLLFPNAKPATFFSVITSPLNTMFGTRIARGMLDSVLLCQTDPERFEHITVHRQGGFLFGSSDLSFSWWLSKYVQRYLDRSLDHIVNIGAQELRVWRPDPDDKQGEEPPARGPGEAETRAQ